MDWGEKGSQQVWTLRRWCSDPAAHVTAMTRGLLVLNLPCSQHLPLTLLWAYPSRTTFTRDRRDKSDLLHWSPCSALWPQYGNLKQDTRDPSVAGYNLTKSWAGVFLFGLAYWGTRNFLFGSTEMSFENASVTKGSCQAHLSSGLALICSFVHSHRAHYLLCYFVIMCWDIRCKTLFSYTSQYHLLYLLLKIVTHKQPSSLYPIFPDIIR